MRGSAAYASWVNLGSEFIQRVLHLDDPLTRDVVVQRGLRVPMPDGVGAARRPVGAAGRR